MKIAIINAERINYLNLPNNVFGNFWITENDEFGVEQNLINIEARDNNWVLISNKDCYYESDNSLVIEVNLNNYNLYKIVNKKNNTIFYLYCYPSYDENFLMYDITDYKNKDFKIGKSESCDLVYKLDLISDEYATIKLTDNGCFIVPTNNSLVFVNNVNSLITNKNLEFGDCIFIYGLRIIYGYIDDRNVLIINNPNNLVSCKIMGNSISKDNLDNFTESDDELDLNLYSDNDYFHKNPRFKYKIEKYVLNIDGQPTKEESDEMPMLLTIGPMLTMSMTSIVMGYSAVNNVMSGSSTWSNAMPSLVICVAMVASMLLWPLFTRKYEKKRKKKKEAKRQEKYKKYLESKRQDINNKIIEQSNILVNSNPSLDECQNVILKKQTNLWERRIEDDDFLSCSLGIGNTPMDIDIHYPEEHFTMNEDNLMDMVNQLGNEEKILKNVPICFSFIKSYITAMVGKKKYCDVLLQNIILQLITFHSYDNLKIVLFTNKENLWKYEYLKILPHAFSDDKQIRFIAASTDEYKEICYNLERVLQKRKEEKNDAILYNQHYLIITDSFKQIRNFDFIKNLLELKKYYGFSTLIINDKLTSLPDTCQSFINISEQNCEILSNETLNNRRKFVIDFNKRYDLYKLSKILANIPIEFNNNSDGKIPDKLGFLEMFDVGKVEQLNILNRWKKNSPMMSLQAPVGVGKSGEIISLDLHEKYHGPHGLIAGTTGSGKSEFIITYILSMAVNYHPYEVSFILIDYKGGGLAGAFENSGLKLPHLVGTITNLEENEINRSLASIESELKRRQILFNKAREISGESTIDIYKYQQMFREKVVEEPISHLFIISDEFAELKNQHPEFMEQLIQTARIGRSLGVHLILATQKPSGVVDPQIWSNTRFRVCLKVSDKSDSNEVIQCSDAAYLKQTGRFYLQVGLNEIYVLGQSAYTGGQYIPSDKIKKTIDSSILFIDNIGYVKKKVDTVKKNVNQTTNGEELINILKYLNEVAKHENINVKPLWLPKMPSNIRIEELQTKYNYQKENFILNPIVGEYDVPDEQKQCLLTVPFSKEGNVLIYGAAQSGKENFIMTTIYSSMLYYDASEVNYYIFDFGAEILKCFENSPLVGDIIYVNDEEKIKNTFNMIQKTINDRRKLFAPYGGSYYNYLKNTNQKIPAIVIIINGYDAFYETYESYDEDLSMLARDCTKYGIYLMITTISPNGIRFKLKQNFSNIYCLQQNDSDDYSSILGNVKNKLPAKIFGRGIIKLNDIYEFQTALITEKDNIVPYVIQKCTELNNTSTIKAPKIPILPEKVTNQDIIQEFNKNNEVIIGIDKNDLEIIKYNFIKENINIITTNDVSLIEPFINPFVNQILAMNYSNVILINAEEISLDDNFKKYYKYYDNNFNNIFNDISQYIKSSYENYKSNDFNKEIFKDVKKTLCIIVGIKSFYNKLSDENQNNFSSLFENISDLDIINYIFIDNIDNIKYYESESWFKSSCNTNNGIWIGNGLDDQYTLKISKRTSDVKKEVASSFCFVVKKGIPILVKFVEKFDIK